MSDGRGQESLLNPPGIGLKNRKKGRVGLDTGVDQGDLNRNKGERLIGQQAEKRHQHRIDGFNKEYLSGSCHIMDNLSSLHHHLRQVGKVRIQQHYLGDLPAGIASVRHSDGTIRFPKGQ